MDTKVTLPDIEDMFEIIDRIRELALVKANLDVELSTAESAMNRVVSNDPAYFVGGKPPSQSYINSTYKHTGLNGELVNKRKEFEELSVEIDYLKSKLDLLKSMIDIWRTQEASERKATF